MKNLILMTSVLVTLIISGSIYNSNEIMTVPSFSKYDTFTKVFHHTCNGSSATGATCSATCKDSESCSCSSGFWSCSCKCTVAKKPITQQSEGPIDQSITPPAMEIMDLVKDVIASEEKTKIANEIVAELSSLYQYGKEGNVEEYTKLAEILDKKMMQLQPTTLQKLVEAINS